MQANNLLKSVDKCDMMQQERKVKTLLQTLREIAILFVGAVEDFCETPYDRSALAKRREKVR